MKLIILGEHYTLPQEQVDFLKNAITEVRAGKGSYAFHLGNGGRPKLKATSKACLRFTHNGRVYMQDKKALRILERTLNDDGQYSIFDFQVGKIIVKTEDEWIPPLLIPQRI